MMATKYVSYFYTFVYYIFIPRACSETLAQISFYILCDGKMFGVVRPTELIHRKNMFLAVFLVL